MVLIPLTPKHARTHPQVQLRNTSRPIMYTFFHGVCNLFLYNNYVCMYCTLYICMIMYIDVHVQGTCVCTHVHVCSYMYMSIHCTCMYMCMYELFYTALAEHCMLYLYLALVI